MFLLIFPLIIIMLSVVLLIMLHILNKNNNYKKIELYINLLKLEIRIITSAK